MIPRLALFAAILSFAVPASAQEVPGRSPAPTFAKLLEACQADLRGTCGGEPVRLSAANRCLRTNRETIAPACRAYLDGSRSARQAAAERLRPARDAARAACDGEVKTICAGLEQGNGRISRCMRENRDKFSNACRAAQDDLARLRRESRSAAAN